MPATSVSTTPMTVIGILEARKALMGLSNQEICTAIGFEREIALTLFKAGTMKMPLGKIPALAAVLQFDAAELLRVALHEADPALAMLIEETFNPLHLSATEVAQIMHQRSLSGDAVGAPIALQGNDVIALAAA
jgi:hypothetical protein